MSELQLEVGGSYSNRMGHVVTITEHNGGEQNRPFSCGGYFYMPNGRLYYDFECERDLVVEITTHKIADSDDPVNHPPHYTSHPSGIEGIKVTEHMGFCIGNAIKYLWRADLKHDAVEDMRKAIWYIEREIERRANNG